MARLARLARVAFERANQHHNLSWARLAVAYIRLKLLELTDLPVALLSMSVMIYYDPQLCTMYMASSFGVFWRDPLKRPNSCSILENNANKI
ncbi:hypothetical protein OnM2_021011 [Erysiphe neolycopersici]|uniref:Uncharacterized protein n=1 Tax=Erysiphe neolycopersici TaxID=212602 RepID=A0A420I373_9PEZI|nr:hypothetical protein OnM2_021011 [Erysiphe neolycopersici]